MSKSILRIGTRRSKLALWQSNHIAQCLREIYPAIQVELVQIITKGDLSQEKNIPLPEIGGKGLFTAELEEALRKKEIDLAVHSLKDLPTEVSAEFSISAIPKRAAANDILISKGGISLSELKIGARIATSSLRRSSQLLKLRPDIKTMGIRGNVDTRIKKIEDPSSEYDAILLAKAGVDRLGLSSKISEVIDYDLILPAAAQGALGIQTRSDDSDTIELLSMLHDSETAAAVLCERAFLSELNAGCNTPVGAFAEIRDNQLYFQGRCLSADGKISVDVSGSGEVSEAESLGREWARQALIRGASDILDSSLKGS